MTLRSLTWENMEKDVDDYIEDFYADGREDELLEPSHFQGLFLLMGIMISAGLGKPTSEEKRVIVEVYTYINL